MVKGQLALMNGSAISDDIIIEDPAQEKIYKHLGFLRLKALIRASYVAQR